MFSNTTALQGYSLYAPITADISSLVIFLKGLPGFASLLFQDEKGPIAAKTYGGSSWSSTQAKIAVERVGICDYTNGRMLTHCYQQKKSNQFIDFIERVDSFYDLNTKRIFLVLDNALIHKSKKTKETLSKQHHPIMTLVFLPTKSPKLNLIEVTGLSTN